MFIKAGRILRKIIRVRQVLLLAFDYRQKIDNVVKHIFFLFV